MSTAIEQQALGCWDAYIRVFCCVQRLRRPGIK